MRKIEILSETKMKWSENCKAKKDKVKICKETKKNIKGTVAWDF